MTAIEEELSFTLWVVQPGAKRGDSKVVGTQKKVEDISSSKMLMS